MDWKSAAGGVTAPGSWRDPGSHLEQVLTHPWYRSLVALQSTFADATAKFWREREVKQAFLPITTDAVSSPMGLGSDSTAVEISIAGVSTHLADSMQFGLELGCRLTDAGVYYLMPSFRGERCDQTHLSQFFHSEAELPVALPELMLVVQQYVLAVTAALVDTNRAELLACATNGIEHAEQLLGRDDPFKILTFDEAAEDLAGSAAPVTTEPSGRWRGLTRASELLLMDRYGEFLWIRDWDPLAVPFYQATENGRALNADLLFGAGEVVGAGQRHTSGNALQVALKEHSLRPSDYKWYAEMKEAVPMLTSGFGMGVERYLMWLLGHADIRDFQLLLRDNGSTFAP